MNSYFIKLNELYKEWNIRALDGEKLLSELGSINRSNHHGKSSIYLGSNVNKDYTLPSYLFEEESLINQFNMLSLEFLNIVNEINQIRFYAEQAILESNNFENLTLDSLNDIFDITEAFIKEYGVKTHIISLISFNMSPIKLNSLKIVWSTNPYLDESIAKKIEVRLNKKHD